jgi:hypothetical protein
MAQVQFTTELPFDDLLFDGLHRSAFMLAPPDGENPVTENIEVVAENGAAALGQIATLERWFNSARERWAGSSDGRPRNKHIPPVYARIDLAESGDWHRAEIIAGRVEVNEPISAYTYPKPVRYLIQFTHTAGWEGAEVDVTLTPQSGGKGTSLNLSLFQNFHIEPTDFDDGNMPARAIIRLQNSNANLVQHATVWLGMFRSFLTTDKWNGKYEAEAGTGGSVVGDGGSSGGQYRSFTWGVSTPTLVQTWTIPASACAYAAGRRVRPVVRWATVPNYTDLSVRFAVRFGGTAELATTPWQRVTPNAGMHEAFSLPLPPRYVGGTPVAHEIVMYGRRTSGASTTLTPDVLYLMAAEQFIRFKPAGYGLPENWELVSDGVAGYTHVYDGLSSSGIYDQQGDYIMLTPNAMHSFNLAHVANVIGVTPVNRTTTVRVRARPRRSTL